MISPLDYLRRRFRPQAPPVVAAAPDPAPTKPLVTPAYVPLAVSVAPVAGGIGLIFDLGEYEITLLLPRSHAVLLADAVLDAIGAEAADAEILQ